MRTIILYSTFNYWITPEIAVQTLSDLIQSTDDAIILVADKGTKEGVKEVCDGCSRVKYYKLNNMNEGAASSYITNEAYKMGSERIFFINRQGT